MYVCMYVYVCVHTHTHKHTYIYIQVHIYMCMYLYIIYVVFLEVMSLCFLANIYYVLLCVYNRCTFKSEIDLNYTFINSTIHVLQTVC